VDLDLELMTPRWRKCPKNPRSCRIFGTVHLQCFTPKGSSETFWEAWDQGFEDCPTIGKWLNEEQGRAAVEAYVTVKNHKFMAKQEAEVEENDFVKDFTKLVNRYSLENGSNTPDFILARYLYDCLLAFNAATTRRERWYGRRGVPVDPPEMPSEPIESN
jgi:hypothetical protein